MTKAANQQDNASSPLIFSDKIATEILHKADLGEGPRGARASPLFWVKEKKNRRRKKSRQGKRQKNQPPPPPSAQGSATVFLAIIAVGLADH